MNAIPVGCLGRPPSGACNAPPLLHPHCAAAAQLPGSAAAAVVRCRGRLHPHPPTQRARHCARFECVCAVRRRKAARQRGGAAGWEEREAAGVQADGKKNRQGVGCHAPSCMCCGVGHALERSRGGGRRHESVARSCGREAVGFFWHRRLRSLTRRLVAARTYPPWRIAPAGRRASLAT